jgi:hypothetical protein
MQRVIRTELYFDPLEIKWRLPERVIGTPGISFLFYHGDSSNLKQTIMGTAFTYPPEFNMLRYSEGFFPFLPPPPQELSRTEIRAFVDGALQNDTYGFYRGSAETYTELNTALIDQIFQTPIIVENSPPEAIPFHQLMSKPSILVIGTFLGMQVSGLTELLFLTAPAGIIVVGSAVSVVRAIDRGLNHYVDRMFGPEPRTPRGRRRTGEPRA